MKIEAVPGQEKNRPRKRKFRSIRGHVHSPQFRFASARKRSCWRATDAEAWWLLGFARPCCCSLCSYIPCLLLDITTTVARRCLNDFNPASIIMPFSPFLRITSTAPRLGPTVARRSKRAASTLSASAPKAQNSLDSILIANRGEIALYVLVQRIDALDRLVC